MDDAKVKAAIDYAKNRGFEAGAAAPAGAEPDLSGQWAGVMTGPELAEMACRHAGLEHGPTGRPGSPAEVLFTDICDAYEAAFEQANRVERQNARRDVEQAR